MATLERRDRAILAFVILAMIAVPLVISVSYSGLNGWNQTTVVAYNPTDVMEGSGYAPNFVKTNATDDYEESQTETYENSTDTILVIAADFDTVVSPTAAQMQFHYNSTFLADTVVSKVVVTWNYVGVGNITKMSLWKAVPDAVVLFSDDTSSFGTNGTYTWTPEAFQAQLIKAATKMTFYIVFADSSYLPIDNDYVEISVAFYTSTALLTQTQLLQGLAMVGTAIFVIIAAAISPVWNPNTSYSRKGD